MTDKESFYSHLFIENMGYLNRCFQSHLDCLRDVKENGRKYLETLREFMWFQYDLEGKPEYGPASDQKLEEIKKVERYFELIDRMALVDPQRFVRLTGKADQLEEYIAANTAPTEVSTKSSGTLSNLVNWGHTAQHSKTNCTKLIRNMVRKEFGFWS